MGITQLFLLDLLFIKSILIPLVNNNRRLLSVAAGLVLLRYSQHPVGETFISLPISAVLPSVWLNSSVILAGWGYCSFSLFPSPSMGRWACSVSLSPLPLKVLLLWPSDFLTALIAFGFHPSIFLVILFGIGLGHWLFLDSIRWISAVTACLIA